VVVFAYETPTVTPTPSFTPTSLPAGAPTATPAYRRVELGPHLVSRADGHYVWTEPYEVAEGEDRVLVFGIAYDVHDGEYVYGVKYDGIPMTLARGCNVDGDYSSGLYYLPNPPEGTHNLFFGINPTGAKFTFGIMTLYNVDLDQPLGETVCQIGSGTRSATVSTAPGDLVVDLFHQYGGNTATVGEGQTEHWNLKVTTSSWSMRGAQSSELATGTEVTMSYGSVKPSSYIVAVFRALQGEQPTPTPTVTGTVQPTATSEPGWQTSYYSYNPDHPHAVAEIVRPSATDSFSYDAIGDMTSRTEAGTTWNQPFSEQGRLAGVMDTGTSDEWSFGYDGDGVRIRQDNPDGTTTLFLGGGGYEVAVNSQGQQAGLRRYFALGGQRVLRADSATYYLLTDRLGSVVAIADSAAGFVSQQRFTPYGTARLSPGITLTDFSFTGQRALVPVGLTNYSARWYSTTGMFFISPDTFVQESGNPQFFNRLAYASTNPLRFTDPTGHYLCEDENCLRPAVYAGPVRVKPALELTSNGEEAKRVFDIFVSLRELYPRFWIDNDSNIAAFMAYILSRETHGPWFQDDWFSGNSQVLDLFVDVAGAYFGTWSAYRFTEAALNSPRGLENAALNWLGTLQSTQGLFGMSEAGLGYRLAGQATETQWNAGFVGIARRILFSPDPAWATGPMPTWGNADLLDAYSPSARKAMQSANVGSSPDEVLYRWGISNPWYMLTQAQVTHWRAVP
jgi:RHS repeat-associated protein